jgi:hypothetical protein
MLVLGFDEEGAVMVQVIVKLTCIVLVQVSMLLTILFWSF